MSASTAAAALKDDQSSIDKEEEDEEYDHASWTRSIAPSHILQDGRFIHLPPPSDAERGQFLSRSIANYGLLSGEKTEGKDEKEEEQEEKTEKEDTSLKVHPLAVASARLNAKGIEELSKAINLSGLVSQGEYFSLSNIVDPNLELVSDKKKDGTTKEAAPASSASDMRLRSSFVGKRKRAQFVSASDFTKRQSQRLASAVVAQKVMDERLIQLRKRWRLVAPEHGTRAKPHPVRPTEVVAMDVHVYNRDRTGGGNLALLANSSSSSQQGASLGRIARRVPRYATVELQDSYQVADHAKAWKDVALQDDSGDNVTMSDAEPKATIEQDAGIQTRCEPFAVADPTLGKINVDFDPDKVPMLTLELTIAKASTGFQQSACLPPLVGDAPEQDEQVVVALQHSLFCASLFEAIRPELDDPQHVWLSSQGEETFLPPPKQMAGSVFDGAVASLCVIHCHEGEVKVQLDSEYVLTVKLVEAGTAVGEHKTSSDDDAMQVEDVTPTQNAQDSGSLSPEQLLVLCRALLLHIQDVYHKHSVEVGRKARLQDEKKAPTGLARTNKQDEVPPPLILQNCVGLGAKLLFEGKIRRALKRIVNWLKSDMNTNEELKAVWLPLSVFDAKSHFALSFKDFLVDVSIDRDGMHVSSCKHDEYKSVVFNSDVEFEIFCKFEIRKRIGQKV